MTKITREMVLEVSERAKASERKRSNLNFHKSHADRLQRFINAMEPGTYVQPHMHDNPAKTEAFIVLQGRVAVVEFDGRGEVADHITLDAEKGNLGVEVEPRVWHTLIALDPGSVLYEIKDGPFDTRTDKTFAPWAPKEGAEGCNEFNAGVLKKIGII